MCLILGVPTKGEGPKIGADEIVISKRYQIGGYSLRAKMIALEKKDKSLPDGSKIRKLGR